MQDRVLLNIKRWKQLPSECAVASVASIINYYDPNVEYGDIRKQLKRKERIDGLYTSQQGKLLNKYGFSKVNIVTSDLNLMDFSWARLSKKSLIKKLQKLRLYYNRKKLVQLKLTPIGCPFLKVLRIYLGKL